MARIWLLAALLVLANYPAKGRNALPGVVNDPAAVEQPLVIVLVDFPDGRLPDGSLPAQDSDLSLVQNIDAVGSMGYVHDSSGAFRPTARKYTYEDYWNAVFAPLFSTAPYTGSRHPDFRSHEGYIPPVADDPTQEVYRLEVYGSMRDYWEEVSYGRLLIQPSRTREFDRPAHKYSTGVVNNVIRAGGKYYVQWIQLPLKKSEYGLGRGPERNPILAAVERLRSLHQNQSGPEHVEFDVDAYTGKIAIITAGGRLGGWTFSNAREFIVPEKLQYLQNYTPSVIFNPIGELAHEFGHTIGIQHQAVGPYDLMHSGGLGLRRHYFCPAHVNPRLKLLMGWLTPADLVKVGSGQTVSLPPITHPGKRVALITLFGDAGRDGDYEHSEYFLVEYRKREKFNRFAGGPGATFLGGALVWHYGRFGRFPFPGGEDVSENFGLKVPNYGSAFRGNGGSPQHFYYSGNSVLDPGTDPSSNSLDGYPTGVSLTGFSESDELLRFTVSYESGGVPAWDRFYRADDPLELPFRGTVYVEGRRTIIQIAFGEGSEVHLSPGGGLVTRRCTLAGSVLQCNGAASLMIAGSLNLTGSLTVRGSGTLVLVSGSELIIGDGGKLATEPGTTLDVRPGAIVRTGEGGMVDVRGKLVARGDQRKRITFTSLERSWSGLLLAGGGAASSTLEYVDVNNVQAAGGAAVCVVGAKDVLIRNCSIANNGSSGTHGLLLWNAGRSEVAHNVISSNGGYGIGVIGSYGHLHHNTISANAAGGVYCSRWASPSFGKPEIDVRDGNNAITGGEIGVEAAHYSYPCLGLSGSCSIGYNNILGRVRVFASDHSDVSAEGNFWGEHPEPGWFLARDGSMIDWQPYLEKEPAGTAGQSAGSLMSAADSSRGDFAEAARCRVVGDYARAKDILSCAIYGASSDEGLSRGAVELVALYAETGDPGLFELCWFGPAQRKGIESFYVLARAKMLLLGGETVEARNLLGEVVARFPGTECACAALLDLCSSSVGVPGLPGGATSMIGSLQQFDAEDDVRVAIWLLNRQDRQEGPVRMERGPARVGGGRNPLTISLEAYPNPFNSSITIRYRLTDRAHVTLSVYNALGQRVTDLVEGEKEAGSHTARFDASCFSSGVYFCLYLAGERKQVIRLLLVR